MRLSLPSCSPRLQPPALPALHPLQPRPCPRQLPDLKSLEVNYNVFDLFCGSFNLDFRIGNWMIMLNRCITFNFNSNQDSRPTSSPWRSKTMFLYSSVGFLIIWFFDLEAAELLEKRTSSAITCVNLSSNNDSSLASRGQMQIIQVLFSVF